MSDTLKHALTRLGGYCTPGILHRMNATINYLETGRWFKSHGFSNSDPVPSRLALFDHVAEEIADKRVAYLEFGVWKGESMRYWSKLLKNPDSVLHGFDSFEGLPEAWNIASGEATFSTQGELPKIDDPRVKFYKGWFDATLEDYEVPDNDVLVLSLDADLYSSTKTVLDALCDSIKPGTYLYFDEFSDRQHELRAFDEFIRATGMSFRALGADATLTHVVFQRTA